MYAGMCVRINTYTKVYMYRLATDEDRKAFCLESTATSLTENANLFA